MSDANAAIDQRVDQDVQSDLKGAASTSAPASSGTVPGYNGYLPVGPKPTPPAKNGDMNAVIDWVEALFHWGTGH